MFEVAAIFLLAWAVLIRGWLVLHSGAFAMVSIFVLLGILAIGFAWVHKKSASEWAFRPSAIFSASALSG